MAKLTQSRAADTLALGIFENQTLELPVPGAPEVLQNRDYGMGCAGSCGCAGKCGGGAMHGIMDTVSALPAAVKIAGVLGLGYLFFKRKRR